MQQVADAIRAANIATHDHIAGDPAFDDADDAASEQQQRAVDTRHVGDAEVGQRIEHAADGQEHDATERNAAEEVTGATMLRPIVRTALVAGAGVVLSWLMQSLLEKRRESKQLEHKAERKAAVSDWENEGGGLAPAHDPRI